MPLKIISHASCHHHAISGHPESPDRLKAIMAAIENHLWRKPPEMISAPLATQHF